MVNEWLSSLMGTLYIGHGVLEHNLVRSHAHAYTSGVTFGAGESYKNTIR